MADVPNWKKSGGGVLDEIGSEIVLLGDNLSDRAALARIASALGSLARYAQEGTVPRLASLCTVFKDFLDALAYQGTARPDDHVKVIHDCYNYLQAFFGGVAEESAETISALRDRLNRGLVELGFAELVQGGADGATPPAPVPAPSPALLPPPGTAEAAASSKPAGEPPKLPTRVSLEYEGIALFQEFVMETMEHLGNIESKVLSLETDPKNADTINAIFRAFHSTKGGAAILGLTRINVLSHQTEQVLTKIRDGEIRPDSGTITLLLAAADLLKRQVGELAAAMRENRTSYEDTIELEDFLARLKQVQAGEAKETVAEPVAEAEGKAAEAARSIAETPAEPKPPLAAQGSRAPGPVVAAPQEWKAWVGRLSDADAAGGSRAGSQAQPSGRPADAARIAAMEAGFIKVDTTKLNYLMELVGELVISQTLVGGDPVLADPDNLRLAKSITQMGKVTRAIQDQVLLLRMVPLSAFFQKMHRLVRDLSASLGKKVQLKISGEHTEIDRSVIEELSDPMVHLLRNAIDHGIEPPEKRKAAGKPEAGLIHLNAYHQSGTVVIEIRDDGAGLNTARIREKAIERGLIASDADLERQELFDLIFLPGFSTAEKATEVSGRGVGMDVVKENIRRIGGRVELSSEEGQGTVVTLKLPLTMAIVDGMVVRVGPQRYIIPTTSIRESVRPAPTQVVTVKQKGELINIRGSLVPLVRLHTVFDIPSARLNPWEALVIVVENDGLPYGILVDDLLGQQQVVIKNLGKMVQNQRAIAGGAILGDGIVSLILDIDGLISANRSAGPRPHRPAVEAA